MSTSGKSVKFQTLLGKFQSSNKKCIRQAFVGPDLPLFLQWGGIAFQVDGKGP